MRIRFEVKLLLVCALFFMAVVALMLFFAMRTERLLVDEIETDLRDFVRTVHFSTRKLSRERGADREELERFIKEAKRSKGVQEVSVVGSTQEVVASSNPQKVGQRQEGLTGQEIVVREQFGQAEAGDRHIHYEVKIPLIRNDQVIGLVQTSLVAEDYRYLLRELYVKNLLIAAGITIFAFGAVFLVLKRMNQPLRRLSAAAGRVATGDLTVQLTGGGQDEVGRLTTSFNAMTRKLADGRQLEDKLHNLERRAILAEMAAGLAHEIRNPLNLINLTADHLGRQFSPEDEDRHQAYQELISNLKIQVRQLNQMVIDFLDVGRPARLKKTLFTWNDLFDEVQRSIKHQVASKTIALEISGCTDASVIADKEQMKLVFINLLLNAIEAVSEHGRIMVKAERCDGEAVVSVTDNGPGIVPEDLQRIFEPYFTKRHDGIGLGLTLVRRIVEEHGGKVQALNQSGGGARFEVTLPAKG